MMCTDFVCLRCLLVTPLTPLRSLLIDCSTDVIPRCLEVCFPLAPQTYTVHSDSVWSLIASDDLSVVYSGGRDRAIFRTHLASRTSELIAVEDGPVTALALEPGAGPGGEGADGGVGATVGLWAATPSPHVRKWAVPRETGGAPGAERSISGAVVEVWVCVQGALRAGGGGGGARGLAWGPGEGDGVDRRAAKSREWKAMVGDRWWGSECLRGVHRGRLTGQERDVHTVSPNFGKPMWPFLFPTLHWCCAVGRRSAGPTGGRLRPSLEANCQPRVRAPEAVIPGTPGGCTAGGGWAYRTTVCIIGMGDVCIVGMVRHS